MQNFQLSLFYNFEALILRSNFYQKYFFIFSSLNLKDFPDKNYYVGCTGYSRRSFLKAFIINGNVSDHQHEFIIIIF